jgi:hypothetical protein
VKTATEINKKKMKYGIKTYHLKKRLKVAKEASMRKFGEKKGYFGS